MNVTQLERNRQHLELHSLRQRLSQPATPKTGTMRIAFGILVAIGIAYNLWSVFN